jgi:hypothetical protein
VSEQLLKPRDPDLPEGAEGWSRTVQWKARSTSQAYRQIGMLKHVEMAEALLGEA